MNSPLKAKLKKFSNFDEQCQTKMTLLANIKQHNKKSNLAFISSLNQSENKPEVKPAFLNFAQNLNLSFDQNKQRIVIIKESVIQKNQIKGSIFVVKIETNVQLSTTLFLTLENYEKRKGFKIQGKKAIPINQYAKGDVKLSFSIPNLSSTAQARLNMDTIKVQFGQKKIVLTTSPKKYKSSIDQFIKQNRGKSAQILRERSLSRKSSSRQSIFNSSTGFKTMNQEQFYRPISSSHSKKDISQFHLFEVQKAKYLSHLKKMCSEKDILLKRTQSYYVSKKQEQLKTLTSWIYLNKFITQSRIKVLELIAERIKKVKIQMLVADFCAIMKSKLRYRITQKARYRMAIKQPLAFLGQILFTIQHPKAQNKVFQCFKKIENYKTALILSQKSKTYFEKTVLIQRYVRKRKEIMQKRSQRILNKKL